MVVIVNVNGMEWNELQMGYLRSVSGIAQRRGMEEK